MPRRTSSMKQLSSMRLRFAAEEGLSFPEPFFWTTAFLDELRARDPDYRRHLLAGTIETFAAAPEKVRVVAEGDSWFNHPCIDEVMGTPRSAVAQRHRGDPHRPSQRHVQERRGRGGGHLR